MARTLRVGVVGAGPTGLVLSLLLERLGVHPIVFDRRPDIARLPAAHVVNVRTCEILRELGVFEAVAAQAAPFEKMRCVTWRETLSGRLFAALPLYGDPERARRRIATSPVRPINIGQDRFDALLLEALLERGGDVRFAHEVVGAERRGPAAVLQLQGPDGARSEETFDYVVACDGARSTVRRALGVDMEGPASLAQFISVYFEADLGAFMRETPGHVHFLAGPEVRGAVIGFDIEKTWALMCVLPPGVAVPEDEAARRALGEMLVRRGIDAPATEFKVISVGSWNMSAQVAARFRDGPFFLAGDAAHRFPPTGGLGLNTGVQDAHNLAWKLASLAQGWGDPGLLDTYERERRPVALANCMHSTENARRTELVEAAIGVPVLGPLDPGLIAAGGAAQRPGGPAADTPERRAMIQEAVEGEREHFDSLRVELGYRYDLGECDAPPGDRPLLGARAPHAWMRGAKGARSTLDLTDGREFALLAGQDCAGFTAAFLEAAEARGLPVVTADLGDAVEGEDEWFGRGVLDRYRAVLVRPDGHVAWCVIKGRPLPGEAELDRLLARLVGALPPGDADGKRPEIREEEQA